MQPTPDAVGIDRLVQIPRMEDRRSSPFLAVGSRTAIQAIFQVKTTRKKLSRTTRLKLSVATTLAESDLPAFVVYIRIDDQEKPIAARVCHIDEEIGEQILCAAARADSELNRETFNLRWKSEHDMLPNEQDLKAKIDQAIGDHETYAERRARWRQRVGFEAKPFSLTVSAPVDAMARLFLGTPMESDRVTISSGEQRRFGRAHPLRLPGAVVTDIGPGRSGDVTLRVHSACGDWVDLEGVLRTPLSVMSLEQIPADIPVWRWCGLGLTLVGHQNRSVSVTVNLDDCPAAPLRAWQNLHRAFVMLTEGPCELALSFTPEQFSVLGGVDLANMANEFADICSILAAAVKFAAIAQIPSEVELLGSELVSDWIERFDWLENQFGNPINVGFDLDDSVVLKLPDDAAVVLVHYCMCSLGKFSAVTILTSAPRSIAAARTASGRFEISSTIASSTSHPLRSANPRDEVRALAQTPRDQRVVVVEVFSIASSASPKSTVRGRRGMTRPVGGG
jgi:hypothetical protein